MQRLRYGSFDCSDPKSFLDCWTNPGKICPNPDLSGIGIVVGYTTNAGIVMIIIVVNYILALQPEKNPFSKEQDDTLPSDNGPHQFKPNPIDMFVITSIRSRIRLSLDHERMLQKMLMKCVLYMSDLQTITGLSLLISGFVQFGHGISDVHWKVLVYLVWFSTVTHFACLSFLRNYFANRPQERNWRVILMSIMAIMLMVALIPTGLDYPLGTDVSCTFKRYPWSYTSDRSNLLSVMILSMLILAFGLFGRLIRMSGQNSASVKSWLREPCSSWAIVNLNRIRNWSNVQKSPMGWRRLMIYRPLLAWFLLIRLVIDLYVSMLGEVLYIVLTFIWGAERLIRQREWAPEEERRWSFGQVVPIVLIGAPLLSFYGYFSRVLRRRSPSNIGTRAITNTDLPVLSEPEQDRSEAPSSISASVPPDVVRDEPELDYYANYRWFRLLVLLFIITITLIFIYAIYNGFFDYRIIYVLPIIGYCTFSIHLYILVALLLEHNTGNNSRAPLSKSFAKWARAVLIILTIGITTATLMINIIIPGLWFTYSMYCLGVPFGMYCLIVPCVKMWNTFQTLACTV